MHADDFDLRHWPLALGVAELGSFRKAAERLGVETSTVSRGVRRLEDELGVSLFERSSQGVRETRAGTEFFKSIRSILADVADAQDRARQAGRATWGSLSVAHVWTFARGPALKLARAFRDSHPDVQLHLVEGGVVDLSRRLRLAHVDVLLSAALEDGDLLLPDLSVMRSAPLWVERLYAVVPSAIGGGAIDWSALRGKRLICRKTDIAAEFASVIARQGGPALAFEAQDCSYEGLIGLVAAGVGWAVLPECLAQHDGDEVRFVALSGAPRLRVHALWREAADNPVLVQFLALARKMYGAQAS